jgi:hypothetical protein
MFMLYMHMYMSIALIMDIGAYNIITLPNNACLRALSYREYLIRHAHTHRWATFRSCARG